MTATDWEEIPADAVAGSNKCKQETEAGKCTGGSACGSSLEGS